jgi:hypothetical protein
MGTSKSGLGKQGWSFTVVPLQYFSTKHLLNSLVVRISAEVSQPRDDRQADGLFLIALELTTMGSPAWENLRYD